MKTHTYVEHALAEKASITFYQEAGSGDRVMVGRNVVKIERATHTSNPHQPARKWFIVARPRNPQAYAAKKVEAGTWEALA